MRQINDGGEPNDDEKPDAMISILGVQALVAFETATKFSNLRSPH
jgi:hypothetical protein